MIWSQPFHQCGFVILQLIFTILSVERTKLLQKFDGGFRIKRDEPSSPTIIIPSHTLSIVLTRSSFMVAQAKSLTHSHPELKHRVFEFSLVGLFITLMHK